MPDRGGRETPRRVAKPTTKRNRAPSARPAATRPRRSASTATSASCCRSCASPCPASRSSSPFCSRSRSSRTSPRSREFDKKIYFATLLLTALSAALLIAPTAYHRLTFRYQQKHRLVFVANRLSIAGLGTLALAMTCAILLVTNVLFGTAATTVVTTVLVLGMFAVLWVALPLKRRLRYRDEGLPLLDPPAGE